MTDSNTSASPSVVNSACVARVAVKIPPFWPADPEMWFAQVETQFALAAVTTEDTKFNYVAGNLDAKYAMEVRDILTNPPSREKYTRLKTELIRRLSASQDQKTRQLLEHEEIGDRKPSQFLRHLRNLAGNVFSDDALRPLWLGRLPGSMQAILATQKEATLDKMAELADAISDSVPRVQVSEATASPQLDAMFQQLTLLTAKMAEVTASLQEIAVVKERSRSRSRGRSQHRSRNRTHPGMCWYHWRFGNQATRCDKPCNFEADSAGNDQGRR